MSIRLVETLTAQRDEWALFCKFSPWYLFRQWNERQWCKKGSHKPPSNPEAERRTDKESGLDTEKERLA